MLHLLPLVKARERLFGDDSFHVIDKADQNLALLLVGIVLDSAVVADLLEEDGCACCHPDD